MAETSFDEGLYVICSFNELPAELRELIDVPMDPEFRGELEYLSRCLQEKKEEANTPKKTIYSLGFKIQNENHIEIHIVYGDEEKCTDFALQFIIEDGKTKLKFVLNKGLFELELWSIDSPKNLLQVAVHHFRVLSILYEDEIKVLKIESSVARKFDLGITSLKKLEKLVVKNKVDVSKLVPIIQHPLKQIIVYGRSEMKELEQLIFNAKDVVSLPDMILTVDQHLRLSAEVVILNIGGLTEYHVINFINCWLDGSLDKNRTLTYFTWKNSEMDAKQLFRRLGKDGDCDMDEIKIESRNVHNKYVKLLRFNKSLTLNFFNGAMTKSASDIDKLLANLYEQ